MAKKEREPSVFEWASKDDWDPQSPRLGLVLTALAEENPEKCIELGLALIVASPKFTRVDEFWLGDAGRAIGSVALCLGRSQEAMGAGQKYAPQWSVKMPRGAAPEETDMPEQEWPIATSSVMIHGLFDWKEWRGFQALAKMALPGDSEGENARRCVEMGRRWTLLAGRGDWAPPVQEIEAAGVALWALAEREALSHFPDGSKAPATARKGAARL